MKTKLIFIAVFSMLLLQATAQDAIHFTAAAPVQKGLSETMANAMKLKVEQILARNNAGASSVNNAFVIQPELTITDKRATEGLIRNVTLVIGELSLTAKNIYDESIYGNLTLEVQGDATGNEEAALTSLLAGIKSNNPAFTRFLRTTRKRIEDHYIQNCPTIMKKAQTMLNMDQAEDAIGYLSSVPETVSCYGEATAMLEMAHSQVKTTDCDKKLLAAKSKYILRDYKAALELLQEIPASSACSEDANSMRDSIAKYINEPVIEKIVVEEEVKAPTPEPVVQEAEPTPAPASYKLNVSCPELNFNLVYCEGNESSQTITIYCRLTNNAANNNATIRITQAFDESGAKYQDFSQSSVHGCSTSIYSNTMPTGVPLAKAFVIKGVAKRLPVLSYVEITVDNCKIAIRNLPVTWK